jgi:hypothetical protein
MFQRSVEQKQALMDNYGRQDTISVLKVKDLLHPMDLPEIFRKWDTEMFTKLGIIVEELTDWGLKKSLVALSSKYLRTLGNICPSLYLLG